MPPFPLCLFFIAKCKLINLLLYDLNFLCCMNSYVLCVCKSADKLSRVSLFRDKVNAVLYGMCIIYARL